MAKWHGKIGYGHAAEHQNGVHKDVITEKTLYGDVIRNTRRLVTGENLNSDITTDNSISVLADAYAIEHFFAIRYVEWAGTLWTVNSVDVQSPRLLLRLGGVYNGPTPPPSGNSGGGAG